MRASAVAVAALWVVVCASEAVANEPTDLRILSVARHDGVVDLVVSVPSGFEASAAADAFSLVMPDGRQVPPTVTTLPSATAAVAIVLDPPPTTSERTARMQGAAVELLRSLPPGTSVAVVGTSAPAVTMSLTTDTAAALTALANASTAGNVSRSDAVAAAAVQISSARFVRPEVVVFDARTNDVPSGQPTAVGAVALRVVPIAATPPSSAGTDPVSIVDAVVGDLTGRFRLTAPDPGPGPLTVRLQSRSGTLDAQTTVTSTPPSSVLATTVPASVPAPPTTAAPSVVASAPTPASRPTSSGSSSHADWFAVGGVVLVGVSAISLYRRWPRRTAARSAAHATFAPFGPPVVPTEMPRMSRVTRTHIKSSMQREYEQRLHVLAFADELGNPAEACRILGIPLRHYDEWKRIADEQGVEALFPTRTPREQTPGEH